MPRLPSRHGEQPLGGPPNSAARPFRFRSCSRMKASAGLRPFSKPTFSLKTGSFTTAAAPPAPAPAELELLTEAGSMEGRAATTTTAAVELEEGPRGASDLPPPRRRSAAKRRARFNPLSSSSSSSSIAKAPLSREARSLFSCSRRFRSTSAFFFSSSARRRRSSAFSSKSFFWRSSCNCSSSSLLRSASLLRCTSGSTPVDTLAEASFSFRSPFRCLPWSFSRPPPLLPAPGCSSI
mmetsp:Transcript_83149/g.211671  ORF Transcript_83149/g.211671 Transcript_83149/m.211671 type:complete len:237 (+) Transcript_83149:47-757(+)